MRKRDELSSTGSCLNKAYDDEMLFILLGRDPAAAATIRFWCFERVRTGLNKQDDPKIVQALNTADQIELDQQQLTGWTGPTEYHDPKTVPFDGSTGRTTTTTTAGRKEGPIPGSSGD